MPPDGALSVVTGFSLWFVKTQAKACAYLHTEEKRETGFAGSTQAGAQANRQGMS
jgi:hypothetical protein